MKKLIFVAFAGVAIMIASCENKSSLAGDNTIDSVEVGVADSAFYGKVGKGTMMNTLEVVTDEGKKMQFTIDDDTISDLQGGVFVGDRITLTADKATNTVHKMVNISSLLGRWTSLDRNFEIKEDGSVVSSVKAESQPYTHWSMSNSRLILNADTFDVLLISPDSLSLESSKGIYVYKRQKSK